MKNRQFSLKVFETSIENEEDFIAFFDTNYLLFQDHLISIKGKMSKSIEEYLDKKGIFYVLNTELPVGRTRKALEKDLSLAIMTPEIQNELESLRENALEHHLEITQYKQELKSFNKKLDERLTVLDTMIRSGRELNIDGDLLLLNRVNSGATINTTGNLIITQVVEGALRCNGQFMMITISPKANIIFNGVAVDNDLLTDKLNRIELKNREIYITPVIQKDINWVK